MFKSKTYILVKPCGFCNRRYHCRDIAIASCKHTFHPFCLREFHRASNKCCIYAQVFHPYWWCSWDFQDEDEDVKKLVDMCVDELQAKMKETLVASASCPQSSSFGLN